MSDTSDSPPWATAAAAIATQFDVDPQHGLSAAQVLERRDRHGANRLRAVQRRSAWKILLAQFDSLLVALLAVAAIVALVFREWVEAVAIFVVLLVNAAIGFVTELQAVRSMAALRKLGVARTRVRRDGAVIDVPAAELVPGDIVIIEGGDVVSADLRIVEASRLQANESTLTGESLPVAKSVERVDAEASIGERRSMLFKGTVVTRGSGTAVVVATGMQTELGHITKLTDEAEDETTPLEQRLEQLGRALVWVALALAAVVIGFGLATDRPLLLLVETAIALAVAAVPEGLPIIATIALARGMRRMARHNALINQLSAVETLGATTVLCTDKTGTLTENRLRVGELHVAAEPPDEAARRHALELGVLCNNASLDDDHDQGVGDPLELALLRAGVDAGIDRSELLERLPERRELAFDPELALMATVHGHAPPYLAAVKGAPEAVLRHAELDDAARRRWLEDGEQLAATGLRMLAIAERELERLDDDVYAGLQLIALVGLIDPPRVAVRETVAALHGAGVRVVMVTGDHPNTARSIARATGLLDDAEDENDASKVVLGSALERAASLPEAERAALLRGLVFARVSPKQKLDLIDLHQAAGTIVAMTGDGVNDAPALRKANIGVAMGKHGTGAAREAADMILEDDQLSTIVYAIEQGRTIFANIRKFVVYLLSCNISEVLIVALAVLAGAPMPLLPLQILFLNLVTDVFPALALGVGEATEDVMQQPPRPADEPVLTRRHWGEIIGYGTLLTATVLLAFYVALRELALSDADAVSVAFLTLAFSQMLHVFNMRGRGTKLLRNEVTRNPWVWGALGLCTALVLGATYIPPLADVLAVTRPDGRTWLLIAGLSFAPLLIGLVIGAIARRRDRRGP